MSASSRPSKRARAAAASESASRAVASSLRARSSSSVERRLLDSSVARREEARSSSAAAVSTAASASRRRRATSSRASGIRSSASPTNAARARTAPTRSSSARTASICPAISSSRRWSSATWARTMSAGAAAMSAFSQLRRPCPSRFVDSPHEGVRGVRRREPRDRPVLPRVRHPARGGPAAAGDTKGRDNRVLRPQGLDQPRRGARFRGASRGDDALLRRDARRARAARRRDREVHRRRGHGGLRAPTTPRGRRAARRSGCRGDAGGARAHQRRPPAPLRRAAGEPDRRQHG